MTDLPTSRDGVPVAPPSPAGLSAPGGSPEAAAPPTRSERAKAATAKARDAAARISTQLETTVLGRLWSRLLEVEFVDRSVALAAKAFVSLFPGLILLAAIAPDSVRQSILENLSRRFGIEGVAFETVRSAFASPAATRAASGIFGAILTFAFMVSFTTALQRTYLRAWRRPPGGGARNKFRGLVWVAGLLVLVFLLGLLRSILKGSTGSLVTWAAGLALSIVGWWWTARLMSRGEVRWRPLLPTAVVTGVGSWLYTLAASIWMPRTLANQYSQFGAFGIALAFVTWLTGLAFVVVVAAVFGPALADGEDPVGRWLRRGRVGILEDGAMSTLPGPSRPMQLSDAFGRGSGGSGNDQVVLVPPPADT